MVNLDIAPSEAWNKALRQRQKISECLPLQLRLREFPQQQITMISSVGTLNRQRVRSSQV